MKENCTINRRASHGIGKAIALTLIARGATIGTATSEKGAEAINAYLDAKARFSIKRD